jgi:hypothetical protein
LHRDTLVMQPELDVPNRTKRVFGDLSRSALGVGMPPRPDRQQAEAGAVTLAELAPVVISLQPYQKRRLAPFDEQQQLYSLIGLALVLLAPVPNGEPCVQCADLWPCKQAKLAYRLREGL